MPRLSDGTYVLPASVNPVVSGTTIESNWANTTMDDVAIALTDSLDREGRGGMNAPFKFEDGVVAAPSITWSNEPNSGWYRAGAGDMRVSIQGSDLFRLQGGQAQIWDGGSWNNLLFAGVDGSVPDGSGMWDTLTWNNSSNAWVAGSTLQINPSNDTVSATTYIEGGTSLVAKYLGIAATAADSDRLNNQLGSFYQDSGNQTSGILDPARLSGSYNINAATATTATNLNGQPAAFYQNSDNQNAGRLPTLRLSGSYNIDINGSATTATTATNATNAGNSDTVDGYNISVQSGNGPPAGADPTTIYFFTG